ncbi:DUF1488 domain-containing protein [Bradyrhizobium sp. LHD-71]|uniref:DUF1488 domain-containing protein n=1 Tax=Bradyrhizobium sp. LHD-71 TaxID=3072141 RepID=UPI00280CC6E9|nr:DUF1488 domain-containing protein [Bradyrhizobium sp. LHD-71]MDQ8726784.1 DUF1488 domain-containing protein [Bradyrhizobium sp. LHD-71]
MRLSTRCALISLDRKGRRLDLQSSDPMAITQGEYQNYDYDRMIVRFTLMQDDVEVPCSISTAAMDALEGRAGVSASQREAQFIRLRQRIEAAAMRKILVSELEGTPRGVVLRSIDFRL